MRIWCTSYECLKWLEIRLDHVKTKPQQWHKTPAPTLGLTREKRIPQRIPQPNFFFPLSPFPPPFIECIEAKRKEKMSRCIEAERKRASSRHRLCLRENLHQDAGCPLQVKQRFQGPSPPPFKPLKERCPCASSRSTQVDRAVSWPDNESP